MYILNGGARPPMPVVGDFSYDLANSTFNIYHPNGWRNTTSDDIRSRAWHPNGNRSIVSFTTRGLPYWMPTNENEDAGIHSRRFGTMNDLLNHFRTTFDAKRIKVSVSPATLSKSHRTRSRVLHANLSWERRETRWRNIERYGRRGRRA